MVKLIFARDICEFQIASRSLQVQDCIGELRSVSVNVLKLIVASLSLSAEFFELIW